MLAAGLALLLVASHLAFILFVVGGGFLVRRWPRLAWLHLPCAAWGVFIECSGRVCPLTPLENLLRRRAGQAGYAESFIEHYLLALVYPEGLTPALQLAAAALVVAANALAYGRLLWARPVREAGERGR
jgi:hypothetical protein